MGETSAIGKGEGRDDLRKKPTAVGNIRAYKKRGIGG